MPCSEHWDGALVMIQGQVAAKKKRDPLGCGSPLIWGSCYCKNAFLWSKSGLKNPGPWGVCKQGRVAAAQAHEAAPWRAMGVGSRMSPPHLKYPALLLPQTMQASFRSLNTQPSFSGLLHLPSALSGMLFPSLHLDRAYSFFRSSWNVTSSGMPPLTPQTKQMPASSSTPLPNYVLLNCPTFFFCNI